MIKQNSIEELRNKCDITDVVNKYTVVKRDMACCPFHDERTASFKIYPAKQTYKCFGCGESGDVFKLIMKKENLNFVEAAEYLAAAAGIGLEYDQQSQQEAQEIKDERKEMLAIAEWANKKYITSLVQLPDDAAAIEYLNVRGYSRERATAWDLGFAPDDWKFITTPLINMGKLMDAIKTGLVYSRDGKNWDFYRTRITIPIHDHNGIVVGLAGRLIPPPPGETEGAKQPKYLNPVESLIYSKKKIWYGLWQAQKAIKEEKFCYVVEGYFDVHAMQDNGMLNTIAACGTEVDDSQIKFLKRYTERVVIAFDGDGPGTKKQMLLINIFLQNNFKVDVLVLPQGKDPDEYINELLKIPQAAVDETYMVRS
jgi:DNA primase